MSYKGRKLNIILGDFNMRSYSSDLFHALLLTIDNFFEATKDPNPIITLHVLKGIIQTAAIRLDQIEQLKEKEGLSYNETKEQWQRIITLRKNLGRIDQLEEEEGEVKNEQGT